MFAFGQKQTFAVQKSMSAGANGEPVKFGGEQWDRFHGLFFC